MLKEQKMLIPRGSAKSPLKLRFSDTQPSQNTNNYSDKGNEIFPPN